MSLTISFALVCVFIALTCSPFAINDVVPRPGNAAFSQGFVWANFDLLPSTAIPTKRREGEEKSDPKSCDISSTDNYIVAFLTRTVTCVTIIIGVFLVREILVRLQCLWYPDSPPPPDMAFPSFEGPVFVAQLMGLADAMAALLTVKCLQWQLFGMVFLLVGPITFFWVAIYKTRKLVGKTHTLKYNRSPRLSLQEMYAGIKTLPGCSANASQMFVCIFHIRFTGSWVKKDDRAKFWGFLMSAYTDGFWLIIGV